MINNPPSPDLPLPSALPTTRPDDAFRHGFYFTLGTATIALLIFLSWKVLDAVLAIAAPFIGAVILSLLLEPLVRWVQVRVTGGHRMRSVGAVFVVFLSILAGIFAFAGPPLVTQSQRLIRFFTPVTYTITRSVSEKDRFVTVADGIADTAFTIKNLVNNADYQFIVYAVNADGEKFASPVAATKPRADADMAEPPPARTEQKEVNSSTPITNVTIPPGSPQSLSARPGDGSVRLMWQPPAEGRSGFDVLRDNIDKWLASHRKIGPVALPKDLDAVTAQYSDQVSQSLQLSASRLTTFVASSLGGLINVILVPIIAIFILADIDKLRARTYMLLPDGVRKFAQTTVRDIEDVFGRYLRGLFIICSMFGGSCMVFLFVASLWLPGLRDYVLLLGVLAGVLYTVPYIGAISTVALTAIAALSTGGGPMGALVAAGGVLFLNQFFDYVVMPKVVGETSGIHPLMAMFALFLGGHLFGLWGLLLAVPIAASLQGVLFRLYPQLAAPTPIALLLPERRPSEEDTVPPPDKEKPKA
ncbi:MAG: AI-2E family transporter [Akkermansiaceae bacterium]|nr:AI-2E family transporter [Armatimonadota bacterium]